MMITVLQQDFGVRYNPDQIKNHDFTEPKAQFIHGMTSGYGGTCVSMPVLYTAIAQRLGYPVKLVTTWSHGFCRWESENDRFNIEGTNQGLNCLSDEEYKKGQFAAPEAWWYGKSGALQSLDADGALAVFISARAAVQSAIGDLQGASNSDRLAAKIDSKRAWQYNGLAGQTAAKMGPSLARKKEFLQRAAVKRPSA